MTGCRGLYRVVLCIRIESRLYGRLPMGRRSWIPFPRGGRLGWGEWNRRIRRSKYENWEDETCGIFRPDRRFVCATPSRRHTAKRPENGLTRSGFDDSPMCSPQILLNSMPVAGCRDARPVVDVAHRIGHRRRLVRHDVSSSGTWWGKLRREMSLSCWERE